MKTRIHFLLVLLIAFPAFAQTPTRIDNPPNARVLSPLLNSENVTLVHVRAGYVTAVRAPSEVSSVVIGDPKNFDAEHSEAEPRLVFVKPLLAKSSETNVLITTKSGQEIALHLVSTENGDVDFLLDFQAPKPDFLVPAIPPSLTVSETKTIGSDAAAVSPPRDTAAKAENELKKQEQTANLRWQGKLFQVAIGRMTEEDSRTMLTFSVLNKSESTVELLPPQLQLSEDHGHKTKAEEVPILGYALTQHKLGPGEQASGVLLFQRPTFKEADEQLFLQIAQAQAVDRPVLVPISFSAPKKEEAHGSE